MGTSQTRERRQNYMLFKFRDAFKIGRMLDTKKFLASFCLEMLASDRQAKEMLKMFENLGRIAVHKDRIEVLK